MTPSTLIRSSRALRCLLAVPILIFAADARADGSPYCEKVRARAASDAALLFAPSVQAQGIKFPNRGSIDTGVTVGHGYQLRAVLTWSPLDFYKGFRVIEVGEADCRAFGANMTLQDLLREGADFGRLPALRKQAVFLDERRDAWSAAAAKSEERFAAKAITVVEVNEVRVRVAELARKREAIRAEAELLELRGAGRVATAVSQIVEDAVARSMELERAASHVRSLAPWHVTVTGGVIPQDSPVDYFGMIQVGFNVGAFARNAAERRYLEARSAELANARYEAREQIRRFREGLRASHARARAELDIVSQKLEALESASRALSASDAPQTPHALAVVELETILAESERVYLSELNNELKGFEEKANAR